MTAGYDNNSTHRPAAVSSGEMVPTSSSTFESGRGKCVSVLANRTKAHAQIVGLRAMMIQPAKLNVQQFPAEKQSQLQPPVAERGKLA